MLIRAELGVIGFTKASNYINNKGEHPKTLIALDWWKIVLNSEDLTENNWLYIGKEPKEEIKAQWNSLKFCEDWVPIIEE